MDNERILPTEVRAMTSSITYSLEVLTLCGVTSFLQLTDVQNLHKNTRFSPHKIYGKV